MIGKLTETPSILESNCKWKLPRCNNIRFSVVFPRLEKMISGMYMGELVRLALERFTKEGLLFGGKGSDLLFERSRFYTKYVSEIESDEPGMFTNQKEILEELGTNQPLICFFVIVDC